MSQKQNTLVSNARQLMRNKRVKCHIPPQLPETIAGKTCLVAIRLASRARFSHRICFQHCHVHTLVAISTIKKPPLAWEAVVCYPLSLLLPKPLGSNANHKDYDNNDNVQQVRLRLLEHVLASPERICKVG